MSAADLVADAELKIQLLAKLCSAVGLQFRSNQLGDFLLAHHNAEPLFALRHNLILPLVGRSSQIWKINVTVLFKGAQLNSLGNQIRIYRWLHVRLPLSGDVAGSWAKLEKMYGSNNDFR